MEFSDDEINESDDTSSDENVLSDDDDILMLTSHLSGPVSFSLDKTLDKPLEKGLAKDLAKPLEKDLVKPLSELGDLFNFYGTDKHRNRYTPVYQTLFSSKKNERITLLEIGIGTLISGVHSSMLGYALPHYKPGGSLRAWRDFFPFGEIYGIDTQPDTQFKDEERITTYLGDSTNPNLPRELFQDNDKFDIIIDDGSHWDQNQLKTLKNFYPYVKKGGFYIIEGIYPSSVFNTNHESIGSYCNNDPYFSAGIKSNMCVFHKS